MKLLDLLNEADSKFDNKLKQIFKQNYPGFVSALGKFVGDPKFRKFIKDTDTSKSQVSLKAIPVSKLIPTQNEVDITKSLGFPLKKNPDSAKIALNGGTVKVMSPIIVFNGKYIIDGHHRWSQLYAMNKDAKIVAYDFTNPDITKPTDALKATQIAIVGAGATKIPTASAKGINLLTIGEAELKKYVQETIVDAVINLFKEIKDIDGKDAIADYIWDNVSSMKKTSQPVAGAPKRDVMPQADLGVAGDTGLKKTIDTLKQGIPLPVSESNILNFTQIGTLNKKQYNMKNTIKLTSILKESKTTLSEAKKLGTSPAIKSMLQDLKKAPGMHIIEKLQDAIDSSGVEMDGTTDTIQSIVTATLFDDIQAAYKAVDAKVAKMIEDAVDDFDYTMVQEKNQKLETIKKHASEIQTKLQKEIKKSKKKK